MALREEALKRIFAQLEKHGTNPLRKGMIERSKPYFEEIMGQAEPPQHLYLHGSFGTKKPDPGDIDVIGKYATRKGAAAAEDLSMKHGESTTEFQSINYNLENIRDLGDAYNHNKLQDAVDIGNERYGTKRFNTQTGELSREGGTQSKGGYKWHRLLNAAFATTAAAGGASLALPEESEAGWRQDLLKKVFAEGVESVEKKELDKLFKHPTNKTLVRYDRDREALLEGWNPEREEILGLSESDPPGLYWVNYKDRQAYASLGLSSEKMQEKYMRGTPIPKGPRGGLPADARRNVSWSKVLGEKNPNATSGAFSDYAVAQPNNPGFTEVIQQKGGNVLAKIGKEYKIISAAGAAALGAAFLPEDADAALTQQFGKAAKGMLKSMKKSVPSSSEDMLIGRTLPAFGEDATIKEVKNLGGDRRAIKLTDGRVFSASKEDLHHLSSMYGTEDQMNTFKEAAHDHRVTMAQNSLKYNESRTRYFQTAAGLMPNRTMRREIVEDWVKEMSRYSDSPALTEQAFVQSRETKKWFLMPKDYAEILDRMGFVWYNKSATKAIREEAIGTQKRWKK